MRRTITVGAAVAALFFGLSLAILAAIGRDGVLVRFDAWMPEAGLAARSPTLDVVSTAFTDLASTAWLTPITIAAVVTLVIRRRSWTPLLLMLVAVAGSLAMTIFGKPLIGRDRPDTVFAVPPFETSAAFPSGHTLNALVIAGVLVALLLERRRTPWGRTLTIVLPALFVVLIGVTRVQLGHHWATDVLAGGTLGIAWLAVVITGYRLVLMRRAPRDDVVPGQAPAEVRSAG